MLDALTLALLVGFRTPDSSLSVFDTSRSQPFPGLDK